MAVIYRELLVTADELYSKEVLLQWSKGTASLMFSIAVVASEHFNTVVESFVTWSIFYMYICIFIIIL